MRKAIIAAAVALLAIPDVAFAAGRIACENDLRDVIRFAEANPQAARAVPEFDDQLEVALAQCRFDWGRAMANIDSLEQALGMHGQLPQMAYQPNFVEWPNAYD